MNASHFRKYIIRQILLDFDCWSKAAEQLLMMTAVAESGLKYIVQKKDGPARGFFQMEPWVCDDLIDNRLRNNETRRCYLRRSGINQTTAHSLMFNLEFMVLSCRYFYMEIPKILPEKQDFDEMWRYYKKYWNTERGKATKVHFFKMWDKYGD